MSKPKPIALFCADLHLSTRKPEWRGEEDYGAVCRDKLVQIMRLGVEHDIPVLIAGDVFDKARDHNALDIFLNAPKPDAGVYAVKGQHDMVSHNEVEKSAFDNACSADHLSHLTSWIFCGCGIILRPSVCVHGCGWGQKIPEPKQNTFNILVIHRQYWHGTPITPGQKDGNAEIALRTELKGFDLIFSGDNHIPFVVSDGERRLFNCGAICRRNIDQATTEPRVYILHDDLTVDVKFLDTQAVWLTEQQEERKRHIEAGAEFVDKLAGGTFKAQDSYKDLLKAEGNKHIGTPVGTMLLELATLERKTA